MRYYDRMLYWMRRYPTIMTCEATTLCHMLLSKGLEFDWRKNGTLDSAKKPQPKPLISRAWAAQLFIQKHLMFYPRPTQSAPLFHLPANIRIDWLMAVQDFVTLIVMETTEKDYRAMLRGHYLLKFRPDSTHAANLIKKGDKAFTETKVMVETLTVPKLKELKHIRKREIVEFYHSSDYGRGLAEVDKYLAEGN